MARENIILGIGAASGHDSGAAILVDNNLVAACEEERLSRIKHDSGFPKRSIQFCLRAAQVKASEVGYVALGWHPWTVPWRRFRFLTDFRLGADLARKGLFLRASVVHPSRIAAQLRQQFLNAKVVFVEHHLAHAASAFYCSPFEQAAMLTMDGRGEWSTGIMGRGQGTRLEKLGSAFFPESLGMVYTAFTHYLGFESNDEYKVMGLSSYGEPEYLDVFRRIFRFDTERMYRVDLSWLQHPSYAKCPWGAKYYSERVVQTLGPARRSQEGVTDVHQNVAKSLQIHLEEVGVELARHLRLRTGCDNLVLAGGVCLNGLMNYCIKQKSGFQSVYVQPASDDGGISLGAAFYVNHHLLGHPRSFVLEHAYWGPEFSDQEIRRELEVCRLTFMRLADPSRAAAELIADNKIIGWYQGKTELGPRALGNRSILADPRDAANKDRVNARIKFREEFRPFAPSILVECVGDYFDGLGESPYMLMIGPVRHEKRDSIPAVVHVDGTARPQTVSRASNPKYYALLEHFHRITGVPVILNTSFNVKSEPIVNSPADAIRCFFSTGLDYLVIGNYLVSKGTLPDQVRCLSCG